MTSEELRASAVAIARQIARLEESVWCESCRALRARVRQANPGVKGVMVRVCPACGEQMNVIGDTFRALGIDIDYEREDDPECDQDDDDCDCDEGDHECGAEV